MIENELQEIDPRNVMSIVSPKVREIVESLYQRHPEYQKWNEGELKDNLHPSLMASRMRISFWEEYDRAQDSGKRMMMTKIYGPLMSEANFYVEFLTKDSNVAWMMSRPSEEFLSMKTDYYSGSDEIGKILRMSLFDNKGNLKIKEAGIFLRAWDLYGNRIHGSIIQRQEIKSATIRMDSISGDPDELRKELEARKSQRNNIIDIKKTE